MTSAPVRNFEAVSLALQQFHQAAGPIDIVISGAAGNSVAPANAMSSNGFRGVLEIDQYLCTVGNGKQLWTGAGCRYMLDWSLPVEWGAEGIRANCIIPGPIDGTEGMDRLTPNPAFRRHIEESVPLRRFGTKQEAAAMAVFLASDAASYVTGSLMYYDGGSTLSLGGAMSPAAFQQFMKSP